jgi:hypothetical protein
MSNGILPQISQDSMKIDSKIGNAFLSHVNLNPNVFFSSWVKHEFKMSHEPNENATHSHTR